MHWTHTMELKRIRHALALAEEMNFIRAAEKVHLSQPALSRSIQALEQELGMALFDRSKQGLAITPIGVEFLARARQLVREASNLERDMALTRSGDIGQLRFGVGPLPAASMASTLLHQLRLERPRLRVSLQVNNSRNLLDCLRNEEIEFFIAETRAITNDGEIRVTPLTRELGPFVCRAGHPLLALTERSLQTLMPYGFASMTIPASLSAAILQAAGMPTDQPLPILFECDDIGLLKQVVMMEDLVMLISQAAVIKEISNGDLVPLPVTGLPEIYAEVGIVQLRGRTLSPAAQLAITTLQAQLASR
jgi:DNA-binding transcriptional LysR family regulator